MNSQKLRNPLIPSFPRKRESRNFKLLQTLWIPAYAGMTTFCKCIIINPQEIGKSTNKPKEKEKAGFDPRLFSPSL